MTEKIVGGYDWRAEVEAIIWREKAETKLLQRLLPYAKTPETIAWLAEILANKVETVDGLHRLHDYKGRKGE